MQGWIMLHRKVRDHWLFTEKRTFSKFEAWVDLLMEVNHKDNKFMLGGELIEVKRGQTLTSIRQLCDRWNWSNTKVSKFLRTLEADGMLTLKSDTKKTLVTVEKYDVYQSHEDEKTTPKRHADDAEATQKHTNNNDNNDNNEKNDNNKKPSRHKYEICDMQLAEKLHSLILQNDPNAKKPNLEKWANDVRLMREKDGRTVEQIDYLITWCQQDSFWKSNILSTSKLREKATALITKIKSDKDKANKKGGVTYERYQPSGGFGDSSEYDDLSL